MARFPDYEVSYRNQKTTTGGSVGITNVREKSTGQTLDFVATRLSKKSGN
ncbi:MAG: hypothetical protein M0Q91_05155 [Methanoregula sp.]|jgi:hypothetical protein|nr:hypothetical protein [Methanoregula sp.]